MNDVINIFLIILVASFWFLIVKRLIWNKFSPVKTIKAEVVDKYKPNEVSNYPGVFKRECYIVVFKTEDKKLSFDVSEFSYSNYTIKEKGTLKYKGAKIISFK